LQLIVPLIEGLKVGLLPLLAKPEGLKSYQEQWKETKASIEKDEFILVAPPGT